MMFTVVESPQSIRQTVKPRADELREPIRNPLGQKINAGITIVPHVRPEVEKLMLRQRGGEQLRSSRPPNRGAQAALGE